MAPVLNAAAAMALAGSASAFVAPSAFKGTAVMGAAKPASSTEFSMSVDCGINGFGRIGRLVARSMIKNPETNLKLINTGAAPEYMAYQVCCVVVVVAMVVLMVVVVGGVLLFVFARDTPVLSQNVCDVSCLSWPPART